MTGRQIGKLRARLDLDAFAFAAVLGVHVSSIYRWEANPLKPRIDPLQVQLLELLQGWIDRVPSSAADVKSTITNGLIQGGTLYALRALLDLMLA